MLSNKKTPEGVENFADGRQAYKIFSTFTFLFHITVIPHRVWNGVTL